MVKKDTFLGRIRDFLLTPIPDGSIKSGADMKAFAEGTKIYMDAIRGEQPSQAKNVHLHKHTVNNNIYLIKTYNKPDGTIIKEEIVIDKDDPRLLQFIGE